MSYQEEVEELIERIVEISDTPIRMSDLLASSTSNNIASLMFGTRLKYSDPRRQKLDEIFSAVGLLTGTLSIRLFFPWMEPIIRLFNIGNPKKLDEVSEELREYVRLVWHCLLIAGLEDLIFTLFSNCDFS